MDAFYANYTSKLAFKNKSKGAHTTKIVVTLNRAYLFQIHEK